MATLAAPLLAGAGSDAASSSSFFSLPDVTVFSLLARRALTDALDRIAGAKTLVIDAKIAGTLGLIAEMPLLREHGVEQIYWLDPGALSQAQKHIVYVCRPEIVLMRTITDQIKSASPAINHTYTILMTPRASIVCTDILGELGVLGSVEIQEIPMSMVPIERDVLSMELPSGAYRDVFLDSLYDSIFEMARSLLTLQRIFGLIPRVLGKGDAAKRLFEIMSRLRKEDPIVDSNPSTGLAGYGQIDSMIVIDRQVDMITPLCTQLTYEGLVDEIIGIKNASVEVDASVTNPVPLTPSSSTAAHFGAQQPPKKKRHLLSTLTTAASVSSSLAGQSQPNGSSDNLFSELRDRNFTVVGSILNRTAKRINADYEGRHQAQTVREMRDFVGKLSGLQAEHQALRLHTSLTEEIMRTTSTDAFNKALEIQQDIVAGVELANQEAAIRNLIDSEANFFTVMRLLCLYSLAANGIKQKTLEDIKRDILHSYGYEYLPMLIYLADLGLLTQAAGTSSSSNRSALTAVRKALRLIVDDIDEANPEDIAYVYSGYAPASVRLVQHALGLSSSSYSASNLMAGIPGVGSANRDRSGSTVVGWKGLDEVMRTLPGAVFDEVQKATGGEQSGIAYTSDQIPVTLVCFIGGCTYTELSALRFTSQRLSNRRIIVATTGMLNGSSVIESLGPGRR